MECVGDTALFPFGDTLSALAPIQRHFEVLESADMTPDRLAGSVLLLGNFDGFHRGHAALLDAARQVARGAPIGIMSVEPHPRQFLAPNAEAFRITSAGTKLEAFAKLGFSFAFMPRFTHAFAAQAAADFVEGTLARGLRVSHVVAGADFRFGHRRAGDVAVLRRIGGERGFGVTEVATFHQQDAVCSSSLVRQMLKVGDIAAATVLLGAPWCVEVEALRSDGNGIEVAWPADVILPAAGDYRILIRSSDDRGPRASGTLRHSRRGMHLRPDRGSAAVPHRDRLVIEFIAS
jgi:riboflavin kinase/FMN adenylyltransferase